MCTNFCTQYGSTQCCGSSIFVIDIEIPYQKCCVKQKLTTKHLMWHRYVKYTKSVSDNYISYSSCASGFQPHHFQNIYVFNAHRAPTIQTIYMYIFERGAHVLVVLNLKSVQTVKKRNTQRITFGWWDLCLNVAHIHVPK